MEEKYSDNLQKLGLSSSWRIFCKSRAVKLISITFNYIQLQRQLHSIIATSLKPNQFEKNWTYGSEIWHRDVKYEMNVFMMDFFCRMHSFLSFIGKLKILVFFKKVSPIAILKVEHTEKSSS